MKSIASKFLYSLGGTFTAIGNKIGHLYKLLEGIIVTLITSDKNITLNDTMKAKMSIELNPSEITQETTKGKNLVNPNSPSTTGATSVSSSGNTITVSSTSTSTIPYATWEFDVVENDVIRMNAIIKNNNGRIVRQIYDGINWGGYSNSDYIDGSSVSSLEYTTPSGISKVRLNLYSNNTIPTGAISSSYDNVIVTKNNSNMTYEPYTYEIASPNPQYPQDIHTISGDNKIIVGNKNLLGLVDGIYEHKGITANVNNGKITLNGTADGTSFITLPILNVINFSNEYYTFSANNQNTINDSSTELRLYTSGTAYTRLTLTTQNNKTTLNTQRTFVYCQMRTSSGVSFNNFEIYPQLEYSQDSTPFKEHQEQLAFLNLPAENLFDGEIELGNINPADGSLSANNTRTRSVNFTKVKPNTTYTFTREITNSYRWIVGYTQNKTGITDGNIAGYASALWQSKLSETTFTFTTSATTEYIKWYDTTSTNINEKVMIELGSIAHPYTEYGKALKYCKIDNDSDKLTKVLLTKLSDDIFEQGSGVSNINSTRIRIKNTIKVYKDKKYRARYIGNNANLQMILNSSSTNTYPFYSGSIGYCGNPTDWVNAKDNIISFTSTNDGYISLIVAYTNNSDITPSDITGSDFIFEEFEINENGQWCLKQIIGIDIVNLISNVGTLGNGNKYMSYTPLNKYNGYNVRAYCTKATYRASDKANTQDGEFYQNPLNFVFVGNSTDTAETLQAKYNGSLLYFLLAQPVYIPLNDTLQTQLTTIYNLLKSYNGQTNISQVNNDLPFEMVIKYMKKPGGQ